MFCSLQIRCVRVGTAGAYSFRGAGGGRRGWRCYGQKRKLRCVCVCVCVWLSHTLRGTNDRLVRRYEVLVLFSRKNFQVCRCVAMCCQAGSWLRCVSYPTGAKAVRGERFALPQQFHARVSLGCGLFRSVEVLLTCFHSPPRVAPPPCHPPHVSRPSIALHRNSPQCAKTVKVKSEDEEHCTQGFVAIGRKGTLLIC